MVGASIMRFVVCIGILLNIIAVNASTITPMQSSVSVTSSSSGDLLIINPVNESGISFNEFSSFSISGSSLKIINTSSYDENSDPVSAAKLIIIKSDDIIINSSVELVGPAADILFISTSENGQISCENCDFKRFSRISLVAAQTINNLSESMALVGELQAQPNASINIDNLYAPGVYQLEIMANNFNATGLIDINVKVNEARHPDINGEFSLGAGSIDAYLGDMRWNYDSQSIVNVNPNSLQQNIAANFNGVSQKFSTSGTFNVTGTLNTKVNYLATSVYKGIDRLPAENITLQSFSTQGTSVLAGNQYSDGNLVVRVNAGLQLPAGQSKISTAYQEYAVKWTLTNYRNLFAHNIKIAAYNVINQAEIEVGSRLEIYAEKNVINHFGGKLFGDTIALQSNKGIVRNGSRTPYLNNVGSEYLLQYEKSHLILTDSETSEMGTYYKNGINVSTGNEYTPQADTSAHISGRVVSLKAPGVENINPYWKNVPTSGEVEFTRNRITQVSIIASEKLLIRGKDESYSNFGYFLNSSAILQVTQATGSIGIETVYLINQRYRNLSMIDYVSVEATSTETLFSRAYTYSPPGVILSLGNIWVSAKAGIVNETSFFEVYGDASFFTGDESSSSYPGGIYDWGVTHGGIEKSDVSYGHYHCSMSSESCGVDYYLRTEYTVLDTKYAPSLFLINGDIIDGPKFHSADLNAWQGIQEHATNQVLAQYQPSWWDSTNDQYVTYTDTGHTITKELNNSLVVSDEDKMTVTWDQNQKIDYWVSDEWGFPLYSHSTSEDFSYVGNFSLTEVMIDFYNSLVDTFTDLVNEFKWWN